MEHRDFILGDITENVQCSSTLCLLCAAMALSRFHISGSEFYLLQLIGGVETQNC